MKLRGEFVVRQILDDIVAIPVGKNALVFNGMIMLNEVSRLIWECLEQETSLDQILTAVTDHFEVSAEEAKEDIVAFLDKLRSVQLLEE